MSKGIGVDPLRHLSVFSPEKFGDRQVDVIGVGALGSRVALELSKLGIRNLHLWDFDEVESHNIANQAFGVHHIGKTKVEAMCEMLWEFSNVEAHPHPVKVNGGEGLGSVVFLLPDSMKSRSEIWNKSVKYNPNIELMIESRMGVDSGRVYSVVPTIPEQVSGYEATLSYTDDEAVVSACGASITVGATAGYLSSLCVWQFLRWWNLRYVEKTEDSVENFLLAGLRGSTQIYASKF